MALKKEIIHKYKGYQIRRSWDPEGKFGVFEAVPIMMLKRANELSEQIIKKPWHGNECSCSDCNYTEEEYAHNREIGKKRKNIIDHMRYNTFQEKTLRSCKDRIDLRQEGLDI